MVINYGLKNEINFMCIYLYFFHSPFCVSSCEKFVCCELLSERRLIVVILGRSVASSLRRLSDSAPIVSLTLKKQISDLIYEAELKQLMRSQKVEEA